MALRYFGRTAALPVSAPLVRVRSSWWLTVVALVGLTIYMAAVLTGHVSSRLLLAGTVLAGAVAAGRRWEVHVSIALTAGFVAGLLRYAYGTWAAYAIPEVLVGLLLVRWAIASGRSKDQSLVHTPVGRTFIVLAAYCLLEFLNPEAPLIRSIFGLRSWLMYTALLFVGYSSYRNIQQFESLSKVLVLLAAATAGYGIWQWQQGPLALADIGGWYSSRAKYMYWFSSAGSVFRAPSTFVTATTFAHNMAAVSILALGSVLSLRSSVTWRIVCAMSLALMVTGIAVSGSRLGPAYLAVALWVMLLMIPRQRTVLAVMFASTLGLWLVTRVTQGAVDERFATLLTDDVFFWKWASPLLRGVLDGLNYPLGRGLGFLVGLPQLVTDQRFDGLNTGGVIDSGWGMVAAELGVPGLIVYLSFACTVAVAAVGAWRRLSPGAHREVFLGPVVWAVLIPVMSPLIGPYASPPISMFQWLFIGMALRAGADSPSGSRIADLPATGPIGTGNRHRSSLRTSVSHPKVPAAAMLARLN